MSDRARFDAVELALVHDLFAACAEEMGATLMRTAHSPNIKERLDHSCAIFDREARLIAQAAHIPVHLGSMPRAVEAARALGPFDAGDVVILNDPFEGGTHLPDITLVSPVWTGGRAEVAPGRRQSAGIAPARSRGARLPAARSRGSAGEPEFYVASRAHHADVGGAAPGSLPIAREVYEEGVRIPPLLLVRAGVLQHDILRLLLANVRTPDERRADLAAQLGAQLTGERRLRELAARFALPSGAAERARGARPRTRPPRAAAAGASAGGERLRAAAGALMDITEQRMRAALRSLPRGRWRFEDALDDDGRSDRPVRIHVTLTLRGGGAVIDFTGSSPQTEGPVNAVAAVTCAASAYVVRAVVGEMPVNDGMFRPITVIAPSGSVVHPLLPAAVGAGNVETSQRIVDTVLGAFHRALPHRIPAASYGTMNNLLIGGNDSRTGKPFAYYETLAGGHGAGPGWDGEHAMQAHMTNTRNTPVEALEHAYPLRVRRTRIRRGSGGNGLWRGGDGIERVVELRSDARVTVISDRRRLAPYGLAGGEAGSRGENRVRLPAVAGDRRMPGKFQIDLPEGTLLTVASPGGGGFGRARRRRRR